MVQKLEKYANNLETIVADRTKELVAEKEKTDQLLHKMLPKSVCYALIEYTKTYCKPTVVTVVMYFRYVHTVTVCTYLKYITVF